jgi:hypothetical protein
MILQLNFESHIGPMTLLYRLVRNTFVKITRWTYRECYEQGVQDHLVPLDVPVLFSRFPLFWAYVFTIRAAAFLRGPGVESGFQCAVLNPLQRHPATLRSASFPVKYEAAGFGLWVAFGDTRNAFHGRAIRPRKESL